MEIFKYGDEQIQYLKKQDQVLGEAIDRIGKIQRRVIPNLFVALINSIVGQQISAKAADTVWNRFLERFQPMNPEILANAAIEELQGCGISMRKAAYIKNAAETVYRGELDLESLVSAPDEEVIQKLSALKGIGVWTAEMLMIFSMERPDVVSYGDLAILRGMKTLYGKEELSKAEFIEYRKKYSPYGSVASLYLWAISKEQ